MKRILRFGLAFVLAVFAIAQLVPVARDNPPVESEVPVTPEARAVLVHACFDCHSNQTVWPWYSKVAPGSWLLAKDVREGRAELNFSTWSRYSAKKQRKLLRGSLEEVKEGEMPLWIYLLGHPEARLSDADREALQRWVDERIAALDAGP
jgi:cytochrome c551/c552